MEENPESFHNVDARSLALWNVSLAVDDGFTEIVSNVIRDKEPLSPLQRLSALDEPADGHVHIIVFCPPPNPLQGAINGRVSKSI
jgi:hypothetical protein